MGVKSRSQEVETWQRTFQGVLKDKGHHVVTVSPNQTVASVAKVLTLNKIGAAPVIDEEDRLVGIISERDTPMKKPKAPATKEAATG
jgi:predicted transcriptional regulator